jgi:inosine/xanthosine triphosphatase
MTLRVALGSTNPVKVAATETVFEAYGDPEVDAVSIDSGVPEQPTGHDETLEGAENRAARALEADASADYGVGIEGGVAEFDLRPGLYLVNWAAVSDGTHIERSGGTVIRLPDSIAARLHDGEELGPLLDDLLDTSGIKKRAGAAGVLTDDAIERQSVLEHALAGAVGPFFTEFYE